jgi:GNAT superfamily N-acetyltransferase
MNIRACHSADDYNTARSMFREYADHLSIDLCFQNFSEELKNIEHIYGPPEGSLLFAEDLSGNWLGCVAIRKVKTTECELKRMYVRPEFRRQGIGKILLDHALDIAGQLGYRQIRLETLPAMKEARQLYFSRGFSENTSDSAGHAGETLFMERELGI